MELNKILDYAIMADETAKNPIKSGYVINGKPYNNYLSNDSFAEFIEDMKTKHPVAYEMYGKGGGKELEERRSGANIYPPKMASFGSSSRMIYNLMKDTDGFLFEKQLPTTVGGIANLDGFIETDENCIFVEAKCREPYSKKENVYERKYESLYNFINRSEKSNVKCDIEDVKDDPKKMRVTFSVNNKQICNFDMKQMISHLLGVATAFLNGTMNVKDITFIYLLFDPTQMEINDKDAKSKIYEVYNNTCYECVSTDFKTLFEIIVDYLKLYKKWDTDIKTNDLADCFSFTLCTQENINKWFI